VTSCHQSACQFEPQFNLCSLVVSHDSNRCHAGFPNGWPSQDTIDLVLSPKGTALPLQGGAGLANLPYIQLKPPPVLSGVTHPCEEGGLKASDRVCGGQQAISKLFRLDECSIRGGKFPCRDPRAGMANRDGIDRLFRVRLMKYPGYGGG
jgi:hypothetical protein